MVERERERQRKWFVIILFKIACTVNVRLCILFHGHEAYAIYDVRVFENF